MLRLFIGKRSDVLYCASETMEDEKGSEGNDLILIHTTTTSTKVLTQYSNTPRKSANDFVLRASEVTVLTDYGN